MTWGNTITILLGTHDEVDDWVDCRVGHGQPEEDQEDVLGGGVGSKSLDGRKKVLLTYTNRHVTLFLGFLCLGNWE